MSEVMNHWRVPAETCRHSRTWMAFGAQEKIWEIPVDGVQVCLASLANNIARYEPVTMLVRPEERKIAAKLCGEGIELIEAELDDIWIRDSGPVFVVGPDGELGAVDLNFNGWGKKQRPRKNDMRVAKLVAGLSDSAYLKTGFIAEGGGIEVDGEGTAIMTESCILNDNRNPGLSKCELEAELKRTLGLSNIIWLPGYIDPSDITDAHTDFFARFVRPGVVVVHFEPNPKLPDYDVTSENRNILERATDANGKKLEIVTINSPLHPRKVLRTKEAALGYLNYYLVNGAVIAPEFGDSEADEKCRETLSRLFPDREIIQLNIDPIASGGGGIHCMTLGEPEAALLPEEESDPLSS